MGLYTQQDPIGIAGGLNLYGYAHGDPINFSDPFGLCPEHITGRPCGLLDLVVIRAEVGGFAKATASLGKPASIGVRGDFGPSGSIEISRSAFLGETDLLSGDLFNLGVGGSASLLGFEAQGQSLASTDPNRNGLTGSVSGPGLSEELGSNHVNNGSRSANNPKVGVGYLVGGSVEVNVDAVREIASRLWDRLSNIGRGN